MTNYKQYYKHFYTMIPENHFITTELSDGARQFDLMHVMNDLGVVFQDLEEMIKYFEMHDFIKPGKYVMMRFHCENQNRIMEGAVAAASGNSDCRPFPVIVTEYFLKVKAG